MTKISETIVFFGSGPVAAESLELIAKDFSIEAVITKPAKNIRDAIPVIDMANKLNLKILTPANVLELEKLFATHPVNSRISVLVDYGIIVSKSVIDYFPLGIVNSHFSMLPEWRGADPITFSILSGQPETGVSLMLINTAMDEGLLLAQEKIKIDNHWSGPELTRQLVQLSDQMLTKYLPMYVSGTLKPYEQDTSTKPTYSRKLTKDDGVIDWSKPASEINQEIKAYLAWPKSHASINGKNVIITKAHTINENGVPGSVDIKDNQIIVHAKNGSLVIDKLKPLGKNEMDSRSYIAGYAS